MNVIQKKSKLGLESNSNSPDALTPWETVHHSLCEYVSKSLGQESVPGEKTIEAGSFKNLASEMPEDLLCFGFGTAERPNMSFAGIEPGVAKMLADRSLGVADNPSPDNTDIKVGLLELLLLAPCSSLVLESIITNIALLADDDSNPLLQQMSQRIGLTDYTVDRETGDWVKLTFHIDIESPPPTEKTKTSKAKKPSVKKQVAVKTKNAFYIFMPKSLMEAISAKHNISPDATAFDPNEPWAIHMREAVGNADVCVKAVLETCDMNVAECTRLSIGQIIPLPGVALHSIALETDTEGGTVELASSTLGTYKANRAVQLTDDIIADFIADLDTISI